MSRDSLGEELTGEREEREHYEPGQPNDNALVKEVLSLYFDGTLQKLYFSEFAEDSYNGKRCAELLEERLSEGLNGGADAFLNDVTLQVLTILEPKKQASAAERLLTPLLGALHRLGHNDFTQDYTCFSRIGHISPAFHLRGTHESQLNVAYRGDFSTFATGAWYCTLELHGSSKWAASQAFASEFHLYGPVQNLALNSAYCTYHIHFTELENLHVFGHFNNAGNHNTFYIHHYPDEKQRNRLRARTWYGEGNRVCFLKDDGNWEGVCLSE